MYDHYVYWLAIAGFAVYGWHMRMARNAYSDKYHTAQQDKVNLERFLMEKRQELLDHSAVIDQQKRVFLLQEKRVDQLKAEIDALKSEKANFQKTLDDLLGQRGVH